MLLDLYRLEVGLSRQQSTLCSTVVGSFFPVFVKKPNKIRPAFGFDAKTCRHTTCQLKLDITMNTCFLYGHVCAHHKT